MKILVLLATYNGERFINDQIDSILSQNGVEVTLKISDDNSNDRTVDLIREYLTENNNVTLAQNYVGTGSAANNFMSQIKKIKEDEKFDYVAFSDQDDVWLSDKLYEAIIALKENEADLYGSNLLKWNYITNEITTLNKAYPQKKYDYLFEGGSAGCTYVISRKFFLKLQKYIQNIDYIKWPKFSHDWLIYFLARMENLNVFIDSRSFIKYRIHDQNLHGHLNSFSFEAIKERIKLVREGWYIDHIREFNKLLPKVSQDKKIYKLYSKNFLSRFYLLFFYNFKLMRSPSKFMMFAIVSLFPLKSKKNV